MLRTLYLRRHTRVVPIMLQAEALVQCASLVNLIVQVLRAVCCIQTAWSRIGICPF
jgi:hypothetical protein